MRENDDGLQFFFNEETEEIVWERPTRNFAIEETGPARPAAIEIPPLLEAQSSAECRVKSSPSPRIEQQPLQPKAQPHPIGTRVYALLNARIPGTHIELKYAALAAAYVTINVLLVMLGERTKAARNWGYLTLPNAAAAVLPATRNSLLVLLLGIPYDKALMFHRWLGRWVVCCVSLHLFFFFSDWSAAHINIWTEMFKDSKNTYGVIAWLALLFILVTSLGWMRRRHFEMFYWLHFSFFLFLIMAALHTEEFVKYLVFAMVFYGLDLALRLLRHARPVRTSGVATLPGGVIHVRFPKPSRWQHRVGQYVFVNFPAVSLLEWHPFSIASGCDEPEVELYIKQMGTFTKKLHARATRDAAMWVRADGPYGRVALNFRRYEHVVAVAGGVGITPVLCLFRDLSRYGVGAEAAAPASLVRAVTVVWIVREPGLALGLAEVLKGCVEAATAQGVRASVRLCVTGEGAEMGALRESALVSSKGVTLETRRPDAKGLLRGVLGGADKSYFVFACGPERLVSGVWDVTNGVRVRGVRCDFHHESFEF
jgi:predicted ferric reductase